MWERVAATKPQSHHQDRPDAPRIRAVFLRRTAVLLVVAGLLALSTGLGRSHALAADGAAATFFSPGAELAALAGIGDPGDGRAPVTALPADSRLSQVAAAVALVRTTLTLASEDGTGTGRSFTEIGSGVLVAPCLVLTARHVLGPAQAAGTALERMSEVWLGGAGRPDVHQARLVLQGGSPGHQRSALLDDWAILELDGVADAPAAPISDNECCSLGRAPHAALIGFPADRFDPVDPKPWVDPACAITARLANRILSTNCHATSGNSGGPLLVLDTQGWSLAGVLTRAPPPDAQGRTVAATTYALPIDRYLVQRIAAARAESACRLPPPALDPGPETEQGRGMEPIPPSPETAAPPELAPEPAPAPRPRRRFPWFSSSSPAPLA